MYFQNYLQLLETYTMIMISLFPSTKKNLLFPEVYNDFNSVNINSYLIIFIDLYSMDFHFYMLKIPFVDRVGFFYYLSLLFASVQICSDFWIAIVTYPRITPKKILTLKRFQR